MQWKSDRSEKDAEYQRKIRRWRKVFAWFPIEIGEPGEDKGEKRWLCFVETKHIDAPYIPSLGALNFFAKTQFWRDVPK